MGGERFNITRVGGVDIREARYFIAVAEEKSFVSAARRLQMSQPPLSQAIRKIERELGVLLFERTSRKVALTVVGNALLPQARGLVLRSSELEMTARTYSERLDGGQPDLQAVPVRIGCIATAIVGFLPAVVPKLSGYSPLVYEMNQAAQKRALESGNIDVGIVRQRGEAKAGFAPLFEEPLVAVVSADHKLAHRESIDLAELSQDPFILYPRESAPAAFDAIIALCGAAGFSPTVAHTAFNDEAILGLVSCGLGTTVVPKMLTRLSMPGISYVRLRDPAAKTWIGLIYPPNDPLGIAEIIAGLAPQIRE